MIEPVPDAPLMLSVSGLRGLVGKSFTGPVAGRYAAVFGQWLVSQLNKNRNLQGQTRPHLVIGRDSRPSGAMIESAVATALTRIGCRVTLLGIVTTPGVSLMVQQLQADGGMVITASHNSIEWNGLKVLDRDGAAPTADQITQVTEQFEADNVDYTVGAPVEMVDHNTDTHRVHVESILNQIDAEAIRRCHIKVVLDSVHGSGGTVTAMLCRQLGVELTHLYDTPTGSFPHPPEPTQQNLSGLCEAVCKHGADIGFAQDPDADRLAIVDEAGRYIGEEYTLALSCLQVLERNPNLVGSNVLVTNLSTSRMIEDIAARLSSRSLGHVDVVRTPVGEANVAAAIRANRALIGGEGNGGVILPSVSQVRDSLVGIGLVLEMLAKRQQPISYLVNEIPKYAIVKDKVDLTTNPSDTIRLINELHQRMQGHYIQQKLDYQDGVRVDWPDRWIHARSSNTEPIFRIIAEAENEPIAREMIIELRDVLGLAQV